jgi:very-short-patch-repair endonuclease
MGMSNRMQTERARSLRQTSTKAEKILWEELRNNKLNVKIRRQHPVDMFVLDFYCPKYKLAIEIDGVSHITQDGREYDAMRTHYLERKGITVLRFLNSEILYNKESVIERIRSILQSIL